MIRTIQQQGAIRVRIGNRGRYCYATPTAKVALGIVAGALALGIAPSAADATIVVGKGMAGITLGQTEAQVKHKLGTGDHGNAPSRWVYTQHRLELEVEYKSRRVVFLATNSRHQRTNKGIGVGSSPAQVRRAYPRGKCLVEKGVTIECVIRAKYHGKTTATLFLFDNTLKDKDLGRAYVVAVEVLGRHR